MCPTLSLGDKIFGNSVWGLTWGQRLVRVSGGLFLLLLPLTFTYTALKDIHFLAKSSEAALVRVSQKLECEAGIGHLRK